jgi:hypothetical protein
MGNEKGLLFLLAEFGQAQIENRGVGEAMAAGRWRHQFWQDGGAGNSGTGAWVGRRGREPIWGVSVKGEAHRGWVLHGSEGAI